MSFDIGTPSGLQEKVWVDIILYLIRRGRENLRQMSKNTFSISCDATGKRFVYQTSSELDKNHEFMTMVLRQLEKGEFMRLVDQCAQLKHSDHIFHT